MEYSREQALKDRAVIPANINVMDASVVYRHGGINTSVPSLKNAEGTDLRRAIFAAVHSEVKDRLVDACLNCHQNLKLSYPNAKSMLVHADISQLQDTARYLRERGFHFVIATSDDTSEAVKSIRDFRESTEVDIILTVQMASEGLNCPSLSLAFHPLLDLQPIEQIIGRATRYDPNGPPYEEQRAQIFCPEDPLMMEVVEKFGQSEQLRSGIRIQRSSRDVQMLIAIRSCLWPHILCIRQFWIWILGGWFNMFKSRRHCLPLEWK